MIHNIALIKLSTHNVHIGRDDDTGDFILFKYDESACDFIVTPDGDLASDWTHEPLPTVTWRVTVTPDDDCE